MRVCMRAPGLPLLGPSLSSGRAVEKVRRKGEGGSLCRAGTAFPFRPPLFEGTGRLDAAQQVAPHPHSTSHIQGPGPFERALTCTIRPSPHPSIPRASFILLTSQIYPFPTAHDSLPQLSSDAQAFPQSPSDLHSPSHNASTTRPPHLSLSCLYDSASPPVYPSPIHATPHIQMRQARALAWLLRLIHCSDLRPPRLTGFRS